MSLGPCETCVHTHCSCDCETCEAAAKTKRPLCQCLCCAYGRRRDAENNIPPVAGVHFEAPR